MDLDKILEKGDSCITDEPSPCTAYCPIHVDVKSFMEELQKDDFKKAYKVIAKTIPFTRIIGRICDHPCENVCARRDIGGPVKISELEKAAIDLGFAAPKKTFQIPKKAGKVAVIGGGLSGIVTAAELDKKGYKVTVFEKSSRLGGSIWDYEGRAINKEVIDEELESISNLGIEVKLNRKVYKEELDALVKQFDAVYLGTGVWQEDLIINPETFQVESSSIFAGGSIANRTSSIILSVSSAKRAVISIDRYVKKVSITASRDREGSFITPLKLDLENVEPVFAFQNSQNRYSREEAVAEAKRCLKCQCIECKLACPHLRKFQMIPKTYVRRINQNERIILGTHYANKMINSCTECGLCKEVCPLSINMKDIIHDTRESMVSRGKMPPSAHDFALKDMEYSNSDLFYMVKSQPEMQGQVQYMFYPGCQLPASYPQYIEKTYSYLTHNIKEGVGLMLGCCGAPADWAGRVDLMKENVDRIRNAWAEMGKPTFILACSSCMGNFEKYMPEIKTISLWEVFVRYGIPEGCKVNKGHILNVHDACATRHNINIHQSVRKLASELGYQIKELKYTRDKTKCCGYGGLVYFANREQAKEFVKDRVEESSEDMLVYCAMCKDLFVDGGKRTYHILDLIFGDDLNTIALRKMPTLSERHKNRMKLKIKLLKEVWGEELGMDLKRSCDYNIIIPEDVKQKMEERYILLEEIEKVVENAQTTQRRFYNPQDSTYLANLRIDNVTYWVRYEEKAEGILVKSVYSHRMEVVE